MIDLSTILYALLGGIIPALLWLWFWLNEDKKNPEPRWNIGRTFFLGMLSVVLVLPFQKGVEILIPGLGLLSILLWAFFEEIFKLGAAYFGGLRTRDDNEPIDAIIYMITAALGFVALENALFILGPLVGEDIPRSIITGNLRFIGASLLHVVSSGIIGAALAFAYYKPLKAARRRGYQAFIVAVAFHVAFNLIILKGGIFGTPLAFIMVWIGVIYLLWAFEKSKSIAPRS